MNAYSKAMESDSQRLRRSFFSALGFAAALWLIKIADSLLALHLGRYGVYPRTVDGLWGILWAPLIHGSFGHLFSNTAPLVVLVTALVYGYPRAAKLVIPGVWLGSGLGVWLFARGSYHIGASGLIFGLLLFLFTAGVLRWERRSIAIALIVFLLYGGMIWGVLPQSAGVSFESHLFGALIGVALAFLLRNRDPAPPAKRYSWEEEEGDDFPGEHAP